MQRILVIQLARMGDLLQSSPLVQGIRKKNGDASITLLASESTKELAGRISGVDEVIGFDFGMACRIIKANKRPLSSKYREFSDLLDGLKGRSFDAVYNLNYSPINAHLMNLIGYREAFCYPLDKSKRKKLKSPWLSYMFSTLGDRRLNRFNLVDIYRHGAGIAGWPQLPSFELADDVRHSVKLFLTHHGVGHQDRLIGFQVGAGDGIRCWPIESYARLADFLTQSREVRILLLGSPAEAQLGKEFEARSERFRERRVGETPIINLVGKTTLQELGAFLSHCELLITPDTGTMHLATAVGTRVLALFLGSAFCHETGPYGDGHWVVYSDLPCYPCFQKDWSCIDPACKKLVSPEGVASVINGILGTNQNRVSGIDGGFPDPRVKLLQSRLGSGFVEYVPVGKAPFSVEDAMSLGYRAMWAGVLDNDWNGESLSARTDRLGDDGGSLSDDTSREIGRLEDDFCRLERVFAEGSASPGVDPAGWTEFLKREEETAVRWVKPLLRFFGVARENIQTAGKDDPIELSKLLAALARGARFMKTFSRNLPQARLLQSHGAMDEHSGK